MAHVCQKKIGSLQTLVESTSDHSTKLDSIVIKFSTFIMLPSLFLLKCYKTNLNEMLQT